MLISWDFKLADHWPDRTQWSRTGMMPPLCRRSSMLVAPLKLRQHVFKMGWQTHETNVWMRGDFCMGHGKICQVWMFVIPRLQSHFLVEWWLHTWHLGGIAATWNCCKWWCPRMVSWWLSSNVGQHVCRLAAKGDLARLQDQRHSLFLKAVS